MKLATAIPALVVSLGLLGGVPSTADAVALPVGTTAITLATITNDRDATVSRMQLMLGDNDQVSGIYMETSPDADSAPDVAGAKVYPIAGIESRDGVVIGEGQGVKAIFLRGNIASTGGKGTLTIRYLKNGVFRSWAECRIDLKRVAPDDWRLLNAYDGQPISQIEVKTWALGISTLSNVCPVQGA